MFNMTTDSGIFRTRDATGWVKASKLGGNIFNPRKAVKRYLPLYEAKLFHQYDHRFATFDGVDDKAIVSGNARNMRDDEKADHQSLIIPRSLDPRSNEVRKKA